MIVHIMIETPENGIHYRDRCKWDYSNITCYELKAMS